MKIVVAPDSFKNSLRASDVARAIAAGWSSVRPQDAVIQIPMSDGGEGLEEALCAALNGAFVERMVCDPFMREHRGKIVISGDTAVIEAAEANGIELLARSELDPLRATSFGVGELIRVALCEFHCRNIIVGIGGSATVDGGVGMLQALGVKFSDKNGKLLSIPAAGEEIARIDSCDLSELPEEILSADLCIASDVTNPLCGETGAARVFAPQKGADPAMVEELEKNLLNFGEKTVAAGIAANFTSPGDGAAGGLGFAFRSYLKARSCSGAELVLELLDFDRALQGADLVLTGEGCSDFQTAHGKLCKIVSDHAGKAGVPVFLLSGALGERAEELEASFDGVFALSAAPVSLDEALAAAPANLRRMGKAIIKLAALQKTE